MRAFTDSFIVSNPGQNYTVSELNVFREKHTFLYGKSGCHSLKKVL